MARKPKLALIDAHALIHRAYHALPPMSTRDGQPTGAVFGFTTMLLKMFSTLKPTHVAAAFDVSGPTFRHKKYKKYKAHRKKLDDELVAQFDVVRDVLRAFNIPIIEKKGFEADDVLGTLTAKLDGGVKKVVVTGDMDTLQLVDDATSVFTLKRGISDTILYDEHLVLERYGFAPELVPDYKGLAGDPSDNIPGVEGIGEKTAKELVGTYGTIEAIYEHLDELPTRAQGRLRGHKRDALFSRTLATIKRDVSLVFDLADAELTDFDADAVREMFNNLEFRSLLTRIPESSRGSVQPTLFRQNPKSKIQSPKLPERYHLVEGEAEQKKLMARLQKEKMIAFDTENDRLGAREFPIVGMSFAVGSAAVGRRTKKPSGVEAYYVPVTPETVKSWKRLLENPNVGKMGHNLKYDWEVLAQSDIHLGPIVFDSMIGSYLLNPGARQHSLDALAAQELGHHCIPITDLIGDGREQKLMSEVPLEQLTPYACEDADVSWQLYEALLPKIKEAGLTRVMDELELPLIEVLAAIELAGVRVDVKHLEELRTRVAAKIARLTRNIWKAAGEEFNINSTQQLRGILYEKLQLPTEDIRRTQSGYSTAASELDKLRDAHAIIPLLEEYRELTKLQGTYIETLPKLVDAKTGRIYASFNQTVAATGRLSGDKPNLQNIPVRTELGKEIRAAFVAGRGRRLVKADYSQLELRIAAHVSGDEKMIEAFRGGEDIHRSTAAWVYGIEPDAVSDKQRRDAKTLNFGVLYGMGAQNFAQAAGVSVEEARSFIERYREQYAGLTEFMAATIQQAQELGYVETLMGRRRMVPEINARAPAVRAAAERAAFNFPIQGTAADILKKSMIGLHELIGKRYQEAAMILTVHDELVCEVAAGEASSLGEDMRSVMEKAFVLDVPLLVDVSVGTNWRDMILVSSE